MREKPHDQSEVSASWCEEFGNSMSLIVGRARCSDLIIMGRKTHNNHLPDNLVERLILESGRPILLLPAQAAHSLYGTIMVCWKNCREAAHAVTAAMPLLRRAARVYIVSVSENEDDEEIVAMDGVARQMRWHGIHAAPRCLRSEGRPIARILSSAANDYEADLMVMGGYSRSPFAEFIFGGCTDTFLRAADHPILLVH